MIPTPVIKKAWIRLRSAGLFFICLWVLQMSVQALISSWWETAVWNGSGGCGQRCSWEWLRGSPAPRRLLPHRYLLLKDYMSTLVPFVASSAGPKGVPEDCGAEEVFSRGAVAWMVEAGAQLHSCLRLRLLDKKVQHLSPSRNITSLVIATVGR